MEPPRTYRRRSSIRRDELMGFWPGLGLAAGLGLVAGVTTMLVLVGWMHLAGVSGTFVPDSSDSAGIATSVGWWGLFWLALSTGLVASLWGAYRAWRALYPVHERRERARDHREAIAAAETILDDARATRLRGR